MNQPKHILKREHRRSTIATLSLLVFAPAFIGCQFESATTKESNASAPTQEFPKVAIVKPVRKSLVRTTEQPGQIEAQMTIPVFTKVAGFVEKMTVDIGDHVTGPVRNADGKIVEPGQLLAVLSATELDEELAQKAAAVRQINAEVEQSDSAVKVARSKVESAMAFVDEAAAGRKRADANLARWKSERDRIQELAAKQAIAQKVADETEQQYAAADAARSEIEAKVRSAEAQLRETESLVDKALSDLKAIRARLNVAESDHDRVAALRSYLQIRAPFSGIVTTRSIDQGMLVQPPRTPMDSPLFHIVQAETVRLFIEVPESESVAIEPGRMAVVRVPAMNRTFNGSIARTAWALQSGTRTLKCEIDVPNKEGHLRPGMYAQVVLTVAERADVLAIPKSAIMMGETHACFVMGADGMIARRPVVVGLQAGTEVEIMSGLSETDEIVAANVASFREGQKVLKADAPK